MRRIDRERLEHLLRKKIQQNCTSEEEMELAQLIPESDDEELKQALFSDWENYKSQEILPEEKSREIISAILSGTKKVNIPPQKKTVGIRLLLKYAAAASILLVALFAFLNRNSSQDRLVASNEKVGIHAPSAKESVDYTRNISLSDGSTVILHKGSTLTYDDDFSKTSREVILTGEAYFDVASDPEKPFIIHSGEIRTIVLGTAFTVKAWPNQKSVVVAVTRGKVKVENNSEVLAILTANQQLDYNIQKTQGLTSETMVDESTNEWIREEMIFDQAPLSRIASVLEKRYKVNINIRDSILSEKIIVSSFNGMEDLVNVLDMLCLIMPEMNYTIEKDSITLFKKADYTLIK
jgi:ferric-dicitrate binding protein FerR (iron transport regulator)